MHCCSSKFEYCSTPKLKRSSGYQLGRIKAWPCAHCLLHVATCICCRGEASALSCASFSGSQIQFVPVAMDFTTLPFLMKALEPCPQCRLCACRAPTS